MSSNKQFATSLFSSTEDAHSIQFKASSCKENINRIIRETHTFLKCFNVADNHFTQTILRNLLNNALIHGNACNPYTTISCHIDILHWPTINISVKDHGNGFMQDTITSTTNSQHVRPKRYLKTPYASHSEVSSETSCSV